MNKQIEKYVRIVFSRIWILLVLAIAAACTVYITCDKEFVKKYEAKMKIIITLSETADVSVYDSMRSSQMAVGDISQIIGSDVVLTSVEKECNVNRMDIVNVMKINAVPNTRILDISVKLNTPERALKLLESLDKNLKGKLKDIDASITYKILSMPYANPVPVNQSYPLLFSIAAALGGLLLGAFINLLIGDRNVLAEGLDYIHTLFEEENILLVPVAKIPKQEGGVQ